MDRSLLTLHSKRLSEIEERDNEDNRNSLSSNHLPTDHDDFIDIY